MKEKIVVSVIVPVYKVEQYLDQCVESIVSQSYPYLEIILVDDGSPDQCPAICDKWAERDGRIKVIHKKNGGLSDARNNGLRESQGEYVIFVDSDDWIERNMVEKLLEIAILYDAEIVNCQFINECNGEKCNDDELKKYDLFIRSGVESVRLLIEDSIVTNHVWRNIYRRKIIKENIFPVGYNFEDIHVMHEIFFAAKKIVFISDIFYHYRINDHGIVNTKNIKNLQDYYMAFDIRERFIERNIPELKSIFTRNKALKFYHEWRNYSKKYKITKDVSLLPLIQSLEEHLEFKGLPLRKYPRVLLLKIRKLFNK